MRELWVGFVFRLIVAAILGTLIIGGYALFGNHIEYWIAYLIAACVVFLGELIFRSDVVDWTN